MSDQRMAFPILKFMSRVIGLLLFGAVLGWLGAPEPAHADSTVVVGLASIERPDASRGGVAGYWALVVRAGGVRYELEQTFASGDAMAPRQVEVAGTAIRAGERLEVRGRVIVVTRQLGLITEVEHVQVGGRILPSGTRPFMGWNCRDADGAVDPVYVEVHQQSRDGEYAMRVETPDYSAEFQDVVLEVSDDAFEFNAHASRQRARLRLLRGSDGRNPSSVPATLRLGGATEGEARLVCDRTR